MYLSPSPQFTTAVNVLVDLALLVSLCFSSSPSLFPQVGGLQLEGCSFDGVHLCENQHDSPSVSAVPPCYMAWVPQVRICVWNSDIFRFTEEICVPETWTDRLRGQQNTFVALLIYILWYNHETNSDLRFFFYFFLSKMKQYKTNPAFAFRKIRTITAFCLAAVKVLQDEQGVPHTHNVTDVDQ